MTIPSPSSNPTPNSYPHQVRARASLTEGELATLGPTDEERVRRLREMPFSQLAAQIMCCSRSEIHALPKVLAPLTRTWRPADSMRVLTLPLL